MKNEAARARLIWTMVRRDLRHIRHHGLFLLLGLSVLLFLLSLGYHVRLVREVATLDGFEWTSYALSEEATTQAGEAEIEGAEKWENFRINGLELVYGFSVLVNLVLSSAAFLSAYGSEIRRGTVRTLTCYPVGFLEITVAKILYAGIVGTIGSLLVLMIPWLSLQQGLAVPLACLATASVTTLMLFSAGAALAGLITVLRGRMTLRPTFLGVATGVLAFVFTQRFLDLMLRVAISSAEPMKVLYPFVLASPYHEMGSLLAWSLGGPPPAAPWLLALPLVIIALGVRTSRSVLPDCYERE